MDYEYLGYAQPLMKDNSIGASLVSLQYGDMECSDSRENLGTFSGADMSFELAIARKFSGLQCSGLGIKVINQKIRAESARGAAVDCGGIFKTGIDNLNVE